MLVRQSYTIGIASKTQLSVRLFAFGNKNRWRTWKNGSVRLMYTCIFSYICVYGLETSNISVQDLSFMVQVTLPLCVCFRHKLLEGREEGEEGDCRKNKSQTKLQSCKRRLTDGINESNWCSYLPCESWLVERKNSGWRDWVTGGRNVFVLYRAAGKFSVVEKFIEVVKIVGAVRECGVEVRPRWPIELRVGKVLHVGRRWGLAGVCWTSVPADRIQTITLISEFSDRRKI